MKCFGFQYPGVHKPGYGIRFVVVFAIVFCMGLAGRSHAIKIPDINSAAEIDYPPFSIVDDAGFASGFSVELMREAMAAMGYDVTFRTGQWDRVRTWLEKGDIHALPLVGRTPERESLFDFTFPYMSLHGAIVVRKKTTDIHDLEDLKGRQVAVMKGDNAEEFLRRKDRGIDVHTTITFEKALQELSMGRHDAVFIQRLVGLRLIRETKLTNLKVLDSPVNDFQQDFCFAVKEGDKDTLALLNEGLSVVIADGTFRRLHLKWFAAMKLPVNRKIIVGGDNNYPPYEFLDENGRPAGYNVDLTRAIARELDLDIEIRLAPWNQVRNALARGDIDVLQGMFYSPERDLGFDFSQPHTVTHSVSVVRKKEGPPPATVKDLAQKRIVVQQGDIMNDFAVKNGLASQVTVVQAQEDALAELASGKHDCALVARPVALYWIKKNRWDNLMVGTKPFLSPSYCFAVRNNQKALLAQFSEGLKTLEETGEYWRIQEKWTGIDAPPLDFIKIAQYVGWVAGPLLVLIFGFLLWSWSLKKQVTLKTRDLKKSEAKYRLIAENMANVITTVDMDLNFTYVSPSIFRLRGFTAEEAMEQSIDQIMTPDSLEILAKAFEQELRLEGSGTADPDRSLTLELEEYKKDGSLIWVENTSSFIRDENNSAVGVLVVSRDITEQKQAEKDRQLEKSRMINLLELNQMTQATTEEIVAFALENGVRLTSSQIGYLAFLNKDETQMTMHSWSKKALELCEIKDSPRFHIIENTGLWGEAVRQRKPIITNDYTAANRFKKGLPEHHIPVIRHMSIPLFEGDRIVALAGVGNKLTDYNKADVRQLTLVMQGMWQLVQRRKAKDDKKKLEAQLHQAQKMESIGRLAGGVAHDYNNALSVIIGFTEIIMDDLDLAAPIRDDLSEVFKAAKRAEKITRQLLAFARKQTIAPEVIDLNKNVDSMLKMLGRLIGEDIDLAWLPGPDLWPVRMDPAQIDQILANLCVNARDAIGGVGKVTIETQNTVFDETYCKDRAGFIPGAFAMIAVSDNGCGMEKQVLENVFEPFYTTKDVDKGTGLGLATVYGIVKQNNGFINIYSEPDSGTTIRIYLPRYTKEASGIPVEHTAQIPDQSGETILLVEDDPQILNLAQKMLAGLGYKVLAAETPEMALALSGKHTSDIDLLITDVIMPEMNGRELAEKLQSVFPGMKFLFMSGYTANVIAHHGVLDEGLHFIQKPFSKSDLAIAIRKALKMGT